MRNCRYVIRWPADSASGGETCDKPAPIKCGEYWFCAEHYDQREKNLRRCVTKGEDIGDGSTGYYSYEFGVIDPLEPDEDFS